jgi:hypothetical protein
MIRQYEKKRIAHQTGKGETELKRDKQLSVPFYTQRHP